MSTSTETPASEAPAAVKTWADVREDASLSGISIQLHAFGEVTSKAWAKAALDAGHWNRIVSIAETTQKEASFHPGRGFSWVSLAAVDGQIIKLAPPAHLLALIEQK